MEQLPRRAVIAGYEGRDNLSTLEDPMLHWAIVFLIIAVVAGVLGFGGVASVAVGFARILFFIFLVLFLLSLLQGVLIH